MSDRGKRAAGKTRSDAKAGIPPEHSTADVDAQPKPDREAGGFPIVGIGASASGLAAFEAYNKAVAGDLR